MGTMARWLVATAIGLIGLACGVGAVEIGVGLPPGSHASPGEPLTLAVSMQALAVDDSKYIRSSWVDELRITASDLDGHAIALQVIARRAGESQRRVDQPGRGGRRQDALLLRGEIDVMGLPDEPVRLRLRYQDVTREITLSRKDVESGQFGTPMGSNANKRSPTYAEFREECLRRIGASPADWGISWQLAEAAIKFGTREESEKYLSRALDSQRLTLERMRASEDPGERAGMGDLETEFERREGMANAVLSLLPEYYAHREDWSILLDWGNNEVVLRDRHSRERIKTVRAAAGKSKAPEIDAP